MKFRPLHDRVLVRRVDEDTKPPEGLSFPTRRKKSPHKVKWWPWEAAHALMTAKLRRWT